MSSKEHPLIFNSDMVKAILDDRKTQTRRVIKPQPVFIDGGGLDKHWYWKITHDDYYECEDESRLERDLLKYSKYQVGDKIWVRESWATFAFLDRKKPSKIHEGIPRPKIWYIAGDDRYDAKYPSVAPSMNIGKTRPSIHMPKWATRIWFEITGLRIEQVQEIKAHDCIHEGLPVPMICDATKYANQTHLNLDKSHEKIRQNFKYLWNSIYAKRGYGWDKNPEVKVIEFKRTK